MESLLDIVGVVSDCTDVPKWDVLVGDTPRAERARKRVCYIIVNAYPHLISALTASANIKTDTICSFSKDVESEIVNDSDARYAVNEIRRRLGLPMVRAKRKKKISPTMRLFGFDYTNDDVERRHRSIRMADVYMRKLCSCGRQPIEPGMVFSLNQSRN